MSPGFPPLSVFSSSSANQWSISHRTTCGRREWQPAGLCERALVCASMRIWATKPCTKLRAAQRSPPEAELRLSSLFSRSGFQLCEERDGVMPCLCCGSSNHTVYWEPAQNIAKDKDSNCHTHMDRQHFALPISEGWLCGTCVLRTCMCSKVKEKEPLCVRNACMCLCRPSVSPVGRSLDVS